MLSDVLSDTVYKIKLYQENFPEYYADLKQDIEQCKAVMEKLQMKLDSIVKDYGQG